MVSINVAYQILLKDLGFYDGVIDGKYGPKTRSAIIKFQKMNGLTPDGIVGRNTKRELDTQLERIEERTTDNLSGVKTNATYNPWPKESTYSLTKFYGEPGTNQEIMEVPYRMRLAWDTDTTIYRFSCHKLVVHAMYDALDMIKQNYTENEIVRYGFDLFGGCLNVRKIRGGTRWSTHAWGIAIDIDPARNRLQWGRDKAFLARPECEGFHEAFKSVGAYNLGIHKNYDFMHTQFAYR